MSFEKDRLLSLIEFAQQSARLRGKPAATIAAHGLFGLYEHEIQGLPGIRFNVNGPDGEDEMWLAVERLHEMRPPDGRRIEACSRPVTTSAKFRRRHNFAS